MRRSLTGLITLLVIGLVLLPTDTNVAAGVLPAAWKPYLWLAWPAEVLLAGALIYGEIRDRRERRLPSGDADEEQEQLARACDRLAPAVQRQWSAEAGLRLLRNPEPIRVTWRSMGRPAVRSASTSPSARRCAPVSLKGRASSRRASRRSESPRLKAGSLCTACLVSFSPR